MTQTTAPFQTVADSSSGTAAQSRSLRPLALLVVHAIVWTVAAWLSRGNLDTQGDMAENYAWGIEWQGGYAKHPPLFAWITAAWFRVFPHTDIAYFALSSLNAMVGLFGIVALAHRFMPRRWALVAGLAMAVSPLYSTLAIKFNANAVLLSVWPWTAYFFVRFMQTGGWRSAVALGVLGAAAVLGKYFSVVLLVALVIAALARPAWRARLLGAQTLVVAAAGIVALLPHVHWLVTHHFMTFGYAEHRTGGTLPAAVARFGVYTLAQIGYLLPSLVFVVLLVDRQKRLHAAKRMALSYVKPSLHADLWWLALGPLFVVGVIAVAAKTQMASVWGMAQWFALVPLWLAVLRRSQISVRPERAVRVLVVYWVLVLIGAAVTGYVNARRGTDDAAEPRAELAADATAHWKQWTGGDAIPVVSGSSHEAQAIAFYSGRSRYWDMTEPQTTPWLQRDEVRREGMLIVCRDGDSACIDDAAAWSGARPVALDLHKHAWGRTLPTYRYWLYPVLPAAGRP
ncbi:MAG TPA: glycosyltransferase family 39 protein [Paraburkholderia sp.]|jgi:4-amino-4-deoxy-L-arabinose transferase-like glycosyltransferase|nr:glycosyltransferase family 39 protein [Paraburkholderia sp.]